MVGDISPSEISQSEDTRTTHLLVGTKSYHASERETEGGREEGRERGREGARERGRERGREGGSKGGRGENE
jgi:hypothetical protein